MSSQSSDNSSVSSNDHISITIPFEKSCDKPSNGIKLFESIKSFVSDLSAVYGDAQRSLLLYNRLLEKTTNHQSKNKHSNIFRLWIKTNSEEILSQSITLKEPMITYSKNAFIDMKSILETSDDETLFTIWKHILHIYSLLEPQAGIAEVLKSLSEKESLRLLEESKNSKESNFLNGLISKIENNVDPENKDPMSAIMGLVTNGVFSDIMNSMSTGLKDGSLDIAKLFGSVQNMAGGSDLSGLDSMMSTMMPMLGGMMPNGASPPSLSSLGLNLGNCESKRLE